MAGSPQHMLTGLLLAVLVAYALSIRLQRFISAPIRELAQVARNVLRQQELLDPRAETAPTTTSAR